MSSLRLLIPFRFGGPPPTWSFPNLTLSVGDPLTRWLPHESLTFRCDLPHRGPPPMTLRIEDKAFPGRLPSFAFLQTLPGPDLPFWLPAFSAECEKEFWRGRLTFGSKTHAAPGHLPVSFAAFGLRDYIVFPHLKTKFVPYSFSCRKRARFIRVCFLPSRFTVFPNLPFEVSLAAVIVLHIRFSRSS